MTNNLQPTPIVDKNGKLTTVHKRGDSTPFSRNLPSVSTPGLTPRENQLADIDELVVEFVDDNTLYETSAINPDTRRFTTDFFEVGKLANGDSLNMSIRLDYVSEDRSSDHVYHTDEMEPVKNFWDITFTGAVNDQTGHGSSYNGDIKDALDEIKIDGAPDPRAAEMKELWAELEHHIVRPGTATQMNQAEALGIDWKQPNDWAEISKRIEVDKGHVFGSKPLIHELTPSVIGRIFDTVGDFKHNH
jgi:hypothetical protein